jgi:hypothetical protein
MGWPKGRPRKKPPPRREDFDRPPPEPILDPGISNDELVEQALVDEIRKRPPVHELASLANAYAKIRMVRVRGDKGGYMEAFNGEDDEPPAVTPPS